MAERAPRLFLGNMPGCRALATHGHAASRVEAGLKQSGLTATLVPLA